MKRVFHVVVPAASFLALAALAAAPPSLESLIQSERQFSATSVEKGMRDAFISYLADEAVVFRPLPTDGKKLWQSRPPRPDTLIWEPSFAEISGAGDIGYTTGPWEFRPVPDSTQSAIVYGHFISVWKKQPEGWRVVADIGVQHEKPEHGVGSGDLTQAPVPKLGKQGKHESIEMAALDRSLAESTRSKGVGGAYVAVATHDFRLNRDGFMPSLGVDPVRAAFDSVGGTLDFETRGSGVANSLDLGYSYGIARLLRRGSEAPSDSGVFLHVWRREAGKKWKLALAVENPL